MERSKALSEGFVSGLGIVTQGADLVAGGGLTEAIKATRRRGAVGGYGLAGFGAVSGGSVRYNSGSHVDMRSFSSVTGLALGLDLAPGRLTLGAFFEYGNGSYDTYNSFANAAAVHGDGDIYYLGGGVLGRMDFNDPGPGHIYTELSVRAGGSKNEYDSSDLRGPAGQKAAYIPSPENILNFGCPAKKVFEMRMTLSPFSF
jgi:hypothetical protein